LPEYIPYSKRRELERRQGLPVTFRYDVMPQQFRVQAYYALVHGIGNIVYSGMAGRKPYGFTLWSEIEDAIKRERGLLELDPKGRDPEKRVITYLQAEKNPEYVLDAIEIAFREAQRDS